MSERPVLVVTEEADYSYTLSFGIAGLIFVVTSVTAAYLYTSNIYLICGAGIGTFLLTCLAPTIRDGYLAIVSLLVVMAIGFGILVVLIFGFAKFYGSS